MASGAVRELVTKIKFVLDKASESNANKAINKLKQAAGRLASTKAKVNVGVNGDKQALSKLGMLRMQLKALSGKVANARVGVQSSGLGGSMAGLAGVIGGGMAVNQVRQTADEMMNLDGRLRIITKSEQERLGLESELYAMGQKTRQPMQALGDLYFRVARASEEMGFAQKDNLKVTETVSKALVVGGASASEAQATILQLGQALGSGRLQGDELRSLDENASILMKHVAKYFNTNVAGLKAMGAQGLLTSEEVMRAIESSADAINAEFENMPMTFGQAMNVMGNAWDRFVLSVEQKSNIFSMLATSFTKAFDSMGKQLDDFTTLMGTPDAEKMVTITEASTGEQKQISQLDYYNQKAAENPGMMQTINALKTIGQLLDELDGKSGNFDEQLASWIETFAKVAIVIAPLLAIVGVIDGIIMLLSPFTGFISSLGSALAGISSVGLAPILAVLGLIASAIYFVKENWDMVVTWFQPALESMLDGLDQLAQAWQNIQPFIDVLIPVIKILATIIGGALVGAVSLLWRIWAFVFNQIASFINWVASLLGDLGETIKWIANGLSGLIDKAMDFLGMKGQIEGVNSEITQRWADRAMGIGSSNSNSQNNVFNLTDVGQVQPAIAGANSWFDFR